MDYSTHFNTKNTPVTKPIPGKKMVENNTAGFTFQVSDEQRVKRFLILGSEGGTYYVGEKTLTIENAEFIKNLAEQGAEWLVPLIVEVSHGGLAPKNDPAIFALAVAASFGTPAVRKMAYDAIPLVCRIGTHIYTFCQSMKSMRGISGRGLKRGLARFYEQKDTDAFAYECMKYRQRNGWTPLDVIRLSHPKLEKGFKGMIEDMKNPEETHKGVPKNWAAFKELQNTTDAKKAVKLMAEHKLPWEAMPTELHKHPEVWEALIPNMGMTALLRNLSRFAKLGLTPPHGLGDNTKEIVSKFTNRELLQKSRLHPITILNGWRAYAGTSRTHWSMGRNVDYTPSTKIMEALDEAFYLSFKNVVPTNKPQMLALDISGSMCSPINGMSLTCREVTAALAMVTLAVEPEAFVVGFSDQIIPLDIRKNQPLDKVIEYIDGLPFSYTDASLAVQYADQNRLKLDAISIYTDNEVNAGGHPSQVLRQYRKKYGVDTKMAVVGMTATNFTIADPADLGMMDIAGFSTDTPATISAFIRGDI